MLTRLLSALGGSAVSFAVYVGDVVMLAVETIGAAVAHKIRWRLFLRQIVEIGLRSQVVVMITGAFTGAVFAAQTYFQFNKLGMGSAVGAVVSVSVCRELGPVLTALMVTGRVGASMSAEIGTMKVTEQIDALRALAVHPIDYLVVPRTLAMMVSMPLLVAESISFGLVAAYLVGVHGFDIPYRWFVDHLVQHTNIEDLATGMIKGLVFGIIITVVSCHQGLSAEEGAVGVGRGTTSAVVISSLALLISNFFLSILLNYFFPIGSGL